MDTMDRFQGLRFERPLIRRIPHWVIPFVVAPGVLALLWLVIPKSTLFWLLLVIVSVLTWMARDGWRPALAGLIRLLQRLEQM